MMKRALSNLLIILTFVIGATASDSLLAKKQEEDPSSRESPQGVWRSEAQIHEQLALIWSTPAPERAVALERMSSAGSEGSAYLSTHPATEERMAAIRSSR